MYIYIGFEVKFRLALHTPVLLTMFQLAHSNVREERVFLVYGNEDHMHKN
jgi:hypothetical protein